MRALPISALSLLCTLFGCADGARTLKVSDASAALQARAAVQAPGARPIQANTDTDITPHHLLRREGCREATR